MVILRKRSNKLYVCSEWQEAKEEKKTTKKLWTAEQEEKFYKQLKDSIVSRKVEVTDDNPPATTEQLAEQLKEFHAAIDSNKQNETYMKCLMGRNLLKIQQITGKRGVGFISFVQKQIQITKYKQSEIYFMMKLHALSEKYPRLRLVTIGSGTLKSRLGKIEKLMGNEKRFWESMG